MKPWILFMALYLLFIFVVAEYQDRQQLISGEGNMSIEEWAMDCYTTINRGRFRVDLNNILARRITDDDIGDSKLSDVANAGVGSPR